MSKHLAQAEKKTGGEKRVNAIRIPVRDNKKKKGSKGHKKGFEDRFQSAMLSKTLDRKFSLTDLILTLLGLALLIVAELLPMTGLVRLLSFLVPFLFAGYTYLFEAFQELVLGIVLGRELIVTLASALAFCSGAWSGGAAIMVFVRLGDLALAYVEELQSSKLSALYSLCPEKAILAAGGEVREVKASELYVGSVIEVAAGATVPADGVVIEGTSVLDANPLTADHFSYPVAAGSVAVSGCVNVSAPLRVRVEKRQEDSICTLLLRGAENAWMHKSAQEQLLQRVFSFLSPALVVISVLLALIPSLVTGLWRVYLLRAAILLTVSQMYSVVQSVKLCYDCAAARAAAAGFVVKGHDVFESLAKAETMVFDKTGTITEGEYRVKEVFPRGVTEGQLLFLAGAAELHSCHPIARALVNASGAYASDISAVDIEEIPGRGVSAFIDGRSVYVGNAAMMEDHGIACTPPSIPGSAIHVAVDGHYIGHIVLEDALRESAFDVIEELRSEGVRTSVLLTGDVHSTARRIASSLNFDLVKAELTPKEKASSVEYLMNNRNVNTTLAFVGEGVCDSEVLRMASVGIALGALDKPEAIEASDAAILSRELRALPKLYALSGRAARAAFLNMIVYGAVKLLVLIFGAVGLFSLTGSLLLQTAAVFFAAINVLCFLRDCDPGKIFTRMKGKKKS